MRHLLDMTPAALKAELTELGEKRFRAKQILEWIWRKGTVDFKAMTNLSKALRDKLAWQYTVLTASVAAEARSADDVTKLLLEYPDGGQVETVLIPDGDRVTACVSTQVGCAMACAFCASGLDGLGRNLTSGDIVEQVLQLQRQTGRAVTNVVFMGTGEPLANYDATIAAVRALTDKDRGALSARRITVSTVGLPEAIRRLAVEDLPITLAVSLHAPDDTLRAELMPVAARSPLAEVLAAARDFYAARHREVTIEYALLAGVNDSDDCADRLGSLAARLRCNVNLIRYNPTAGLPFDRPDEQTVRRFAERLSRRGVNANIRRSRGGDVQAACGQLRRREQGD
ncbi:MAG: 23S rRNA (adenine(2503)-C(2))-methyltransferase RlmN [Planctomycetes bacterium]|jgi:23S rRNA (adenine2503-C2)-methyltransferase|nr:23S rRNA (adenine(2503)-C(2))-methyltransferase RlmN [Phycisphaerae bacterium]NBB94837.1 23S rRNA (adenine(2503)-C(2))-methyltransferase RlmN [Planctomycetota bacterium]